MHWSRLVLTNRQRQNWMVYPTKYTCLCLFWRISSSKKTSMVALPRAWSHNRRKMAGLFGRVWRLHASNSAKHRVKDFGPGLREPFADCDLIGPVKMYAVKGRSIQNNLLLVTVVLKWQEDGTEAVLINLDQAKAFDKVDHRFFVTILETTGFKPKFRK